MYLSPDFHYGIFEHPYEGKHYLSVIHLEGDHRGNILKLIPTSDRNRTFSAFFTNDNKFIVIKLKSGDYSLFRIDTGRLLCTLK